MTYRLSDVYTAIADPNRREIIDLLRTQELNVAEIAAHFDMSRTAVDKHLKVLRESDLITVSKLGRTRLHQLDAAPLEAIWDWIMPYSEFWGDRIQHLKKLVEERESSKRKTKS